MLVVVVCDDGQELICETEVSGLKPSWVNATLPSLEDHSLYGSTSLPHTGLKHFSIVVSIVYSTGSSFQAAHHIFHSNFHLRIFH